MLLGHLNPLPIHCIAVIARRRFSVHGHPVDPPINRGPELQLEPTPPLHSTKSTPLEGPRGGLLPRLRPPRSATGSSSIRSLCRPPPELSTTTRAAVRRRKCRRRRGALRRSSPPPTDAEGHAEALGTLRSPCLAVVRRRRPPQSSGAGELLNLTCGTPMSASLLSLPRNVFCWRLRAKYVFPFELARFFPKRFLFSQFSPWNFSVSFQMSPWTETFITF